MNEGKSKKSIHPKIQIIVRGIENRKQASDFPYALPAPHVRATIGNRKEVRRMKHYYFTNDKENQSPAEILQEAHERIY